MNIFILNFFTKLDDIEELNYNGNLRYQNKFDFFFFTDRVKTQNVPKTVVMGFFCCIDNIVIYK